MKYVKYLAILPITLMTAGIALAKGDIFYEVPFYKAEIKAASKIYVHYNFDSHKQVLVCKEEPVSSAITSVEWGYKDASRKIELPVRLKDDARFKGHDADPEGKLVITNEFVSSSKDGTIFASCEYQNAN